MMYISSVLLVILYVYIGFSEAAPRISPYDASPISRKPGSAPDTWETFHTDMPRTLPESRFALGPLTGLTPSPAIVSAGPNTISPISKTATTFQPPTTDPTTATTSTTTAPDTGVISDTKEQISAPTSRLTGTRKRSADAQTSLFAPEKMLQTMVSMVSQRTANDAWAADNVGTSITSTENSQGEYLRMKGLRGTVGGKTLRFFAFVNAASPSHKKNRKNRQLGEKFWATCFFWKHSC